MDHTTRPAKPATHVPPKFHEPVRERITGIPNDRDFAFMSPDDQRRFVQAQGHTQ